MIKANYKTMLNEKSVIRELFDYARKRGGEIGYENVFDYSLGNPSVPVPEAFTEALVDLLQTEDPVALHGYSPTLGIPSVLETVADSLKRRFGLEYKSAHIFMTSGAAGAIAHALRAVTSPGDEVILFAPFFPEYIPYIELAGAVTRIVPPNTETFQINLEVFEQMVTPKTMAVLINTPNNPSGVVYSTHTIQSVADILRRKEREYGHDIYILSDEPYREIVFQGVDAPCVSRYYENTLVCYSFSKSLSLPGERIGYVAVSPACASGEDIIQMCGQISRGIGHNCPSTLMQLGVARVINMTADLSVYETNCSILYQELTGLGLTCVKPDGTFYIFPKALEQDAVKFCGKAKKYDLMLVPGDSFGCPGFFRMSYCMETEKVKRSLAAWNRFVLQEYN